MPSPIASSFGTKSEEEWGASKPHPNDRISISKYVGGAATPLDIKDWMWILNYVRRRPNWAVNVHRGYVTLVILGHAVRGTYRDVAVPDDEGRV
jgi:hypothetical protein